MAGRSAESAVAPARQRRSVRAAQLQTVASATSGMRASTTTRTPCRTVSRLRTITPLGSRKVNVLVAWPAPSGNVRVVWNTAEGRPGR